MAAILGRLALAVKHDWPLILAAGCTFSIWPIAYADSYAKCDDIADETEKKQCQNVNVRDPHYIMIPITIVVVSVLLKVLYGAVVQHSNSLQKEKWQESIGKLAAKAMTAS